MALTVARAINVADFVVDELGDVDGGGLTYEPVRVWSFGFTDAELNTLRVAVRVDDIDLETGERGNETNDYRIEVTVRKLVQRKDIERIDLLFNLMVAFANLYPIDRIVDVPGDAGTSKMFVTGKRYFPLMFKSNDSATKDGVMDTIAPTSKFISSLLLTFREWVSE